jgi:hypothetical protein
VCFYSHLFQLPDVQISHEDLIKVLQPLCLQDGPLAKIVLSSFVIGLIEGLSEHQDAEVCRFLITHRYPL